MMEAENRKQYENSHSTENKAPKRYITQFGDGHIDCLDANLIGRQVAIELVNGRIISGKLRYLGQYDLILMDSRTGWDVLIMKHAVLTITGDLTPKPK
ncbi:MAG: hypothetical protein QW292_04805 [Candidatus Parvarchaeota archaeon]